MLITLAENLALARFTTIQLDNVDVRGFSRVSILADAQPNTTNSQTSAEGLITIHWAADEFGNRVNSVDGILAAGVCNVGFGQTSCPNVGMDHGSIVNGPFLSLLLNSIGAVDGTFTVRVFLQR